MNNKKKAYQKPQILASFDSREVKPAYRLMQTQPTVSPARVATA